MKSVGIFTTITLIAAMWLASASLLFAQPLSQSVSQELEYVDAIVTKGIRDDDVEKIAEAHRVLSNLNVTLGGLAEAKDRTIFTLAIGYEYVRMCPVVLANQLMSPGNITGFTIDCPERSQWYFTQAIKIAKEGLDATALADAYFIAGLGIDRLKFNLSEFSGTPNKKFYDLALEYIRQAVKTGPSIAGAKTVLNRLENEDYKVKSVIDEQQFQELMKLLIFNGTKTDGDQKGTEPDKDTGKQAKSIAPVEDENTYVDYKLRFAVKKPGKDWEFTSQKTGASLHITVKRKSDGEQKGSGINIVCHPLVELEAGMTPAALMEKSVRLLQNAGYEIKDKKPIDLKGSSAYELISMHKYSDLIPAESRNATDTSAVGLVSQQYMILAVSNGIEYIISFSALEADYSAIFPIYKAIVDTVTFF